MARVLSIVLAGGEGKRLMPLTEDRAKPAVPFGGSYRLIDFALSNLVNAGYTRIAVLTQYKSHSLDRHISSAWRLAPMLGSYVAPVPAQQRRGPQWYQGSADAIYQSMNLINDDGPDYIVVFGADHVYRMDASQMVRAHIESGAGVTVAGIRVPRSEAYQFGGIQTAADGITIEVPEPNPRSVTVLREFEDLVRIGLGDLKPHALLLGRKEDRRNLAARAIGDAVVLGDVPHIEQSRLRATWLARLMAAPVPLAVLLSAAGLRSARTLVDLLPHLEVGTDTHCVLRDPGDVR